MGCDTCGAQVVDVERHKRWHAAIDSIDRTADEALERAESAHNILYQNNIDI